MKTVTLLCFLLFASLTWGQFITPSVVNGQPQPLRMANHAQQASAAPMGAHHSLLGSSTSTSGTGERPLWELAPPSNPVSLGDAARVIRKQHETSKKAAFVREN